MMALMAVMMAVWWRWCDDCGDDYRDDGSDNGSYDGIDDDGNDGGDDGRDDGRDNGGDDGMNGLKMVFDYSDEGKDVYLSCIVDITGVQSHGLQAGVVEVFTWGESGGQGPTFVHFFF